MDIISRVSFLMKYNPSLKESFNEQVTNSKNPSMATPYPGYAADVESLKTLAPKQTIEYPYYCSNPSKAKLPTMQTGGVTGEEALIPGYCFYSAPQKKSKEGGTEGIYIVSNSPISFWTEDSIKRFAYTLKNNKRGNYSKNINEIVNNLKKILPIDSVRAFKDKDGVLYKTYLIADFNPAGEWSYNPWQFLGFYDDNKKPYVPPVWKDERNVVEKTIDIIGPWVQIVSVIGLVIAGFFSYGSTWFIATEVAIAIGIDLPIAIREFQKGENITGGLTSFFAILPFLKFSKTLRGISKSAFDGLVESIKNSGISKSSSYQELTKFYESLPSEQKKIISQMLEGLDNVTMNELKRELGPVIENSIIRPLNRELKVFSQKYPKKYSEILFKLDSIDKLWVKELSAAGIGIATSIILETTFGEELNATEIEILDGVYYSLPPEKAKQYEEIVKTHISQIQKITTESIETQKYLEQLNAGVTLNKDSLSVWQDNLLRDLNPQDSADNNSNTLSIDHNKSSNYFRRRGYIPKTEWLALDTMSELIDFKLSSDGEEWYLIKK